MERRKGHAGLWEHNIRQTSEGPRRTWEGDNKMDLEQMDWEVEE